MSAMQQNPTQNQTPNQQTPAPPPAPEYKFRWGLILGIPLAIIIFFGLLKNIEASFSIENILNRLGVIYRAKYCRLASFAVICLVFILIAKLSRNHSD